MRLVWVYGLIPQAMAMGFSGILLPLYVTLHLGGSLMDVGVLAAISGFSLIPSLILWGYLAERFYLHKTFFTLSFVGMGVALLLMPLARNVFELGVLVALRSAFYAASVPTRETLIFESVSREYWEPGVARLKLVTGLGESIGMLLGAVVTQFLVFGALFTLCGLLSFASALVSIMLVVVPPLMIVRRLISIEHFVDLLAKASTAVCYANIYAHTKSTKKILQIYKPSLSFFLAGVFTFSLAGNLLFTPLPIYFLNFYPTHIIFTLFFTHSLAITFSYPAISHLAKNGWKALMVSSALRILLIPLLSLQNVLDGYGFAVAAVILGSLGVMWAIFDVSSSCIYYEHSNIGRSGVYSAVIGLGAATGGLLGGYFSMLYGYDALFTLCAFAYLLTLLLFTIQFRKCCC